ncbi:uncharacterized protein MYCFIDRAFT_179028 [Pseudocercospora fijiensis CIRAD86]|uniref:Uncharacterized protein n=1 Tax=Pseudocercospora fijiensis (strain CIRAD86) TaxID=383855 RepID=M2YMH7_PSEFD|nr:uncharacterized protein MYCFIDRAFT_179028 [Pseudocercospora fijiensis CIRAD86]EME78950.1 hypothetical protein MYCFIDRAFT_179028 [Pseudocercospora fijiensis CIRAD86]
MIYCVSTAGPLGSARSRQAGRGVRCRERVLRDAHESHGPSNAVRRWMMWYSTMQEVKSCTTVSDNTTVFFPGATRELGLLQRLLNEMKSKETRQAHASECTPPILPAPTTSCIRASTQRRKSILRPVVNGFAVVSRIPAPVAAATTIAVPGSSDQIVGAGPCASALRGMTMIEESKIAQHEQASLINLVLCNNTIGLWRPCASVCRRSTPISISSLYPVTIIRDLEAWLACEWSSWEVHKRLPPPPHTPMSALFLCTCTKNLLEFQNLGLTFPNIAIDLSAPWTSSRHPSFETPTTTRSISSVFFTKPPQICQRFTVQLQDYTTSNFDVFCHRLARTSYPQATIKQEHYCFGPL